MQHAPREKSAWLAVKLKATNVLEDEWLMPKWLTKTGNDWLKLPLTISRRAAALVATAVDQQQSLYEIT
jgi:hypothetical protein